MTGSMLKGNDTCCETRMSAAKVERLEWVTSRRTLSSAGSCSLDDAMAAARVWAMGVWPACAGVFIYITKHLARVACPIMATTKIY